MAKVINYLRPSSDVHGDWIFGSILKALCAESPLFYGSDRWMRNADAYFAQPACTVTRRIVHRSLVRFTNYRMDRTLVKVVNKAPVLVAHCHGQLEWLSSHGVREPDAVISAGWQPGITTRQSMPDKFTVGVFGHERIHAVLQTQSGELLGNELVKGTDRIPLIAKHLDPNRVAWHFGGPLWTECLAYHRLREMGFEVTTAHYPAHEVASGYHKLDCLLVASRTEAGPGVGLDALAAGIPVISTRVGQMIELSDMLWDKESEAAEYILRIQDERDKYFERRHRYSSLVANRTRDHFAKKVVQLIHERILGP